MLTLKHLRGLSYEKTIKNVKESLILRQFCRIYFHPLPNKSTLIRWANTLSEKTLAQINQRLTEIATQLKITQGRKMRTDGTVVATNIHSDIICRGKPNLDVEFGRKVWLDEVDGGIISNYRVLKGNPHDTQQLVSSLDQHIGNFGHPPKLVSSDRGVYSQSNENYAQSLGIKQVILPKGGYRNKQRIQHERKRNFRKGRHWHNGVEGRISFLKRCFGFQRCLYRGDIGFQRWVGWGIIAHNLTIISRCLVSQSRNIN